MAIPFVYQGDSGTPLALLQTAIPEKIPAVRFDLLPVALFLMPTVRMFEGAAIGEERAPETVDSVKDHIHSTTVNLDRPIAENIGEGSTKNPCNVVANRVHFRPVNKLVIEEERDLAAHPRLANGPHDRINRITGFDMVAQVGERLFAFCDLLFSELRH